MCQCSSYRARRLDLHRKTLPPPCSSHSQRSLRLCKVMLKRTRYTALSNPQEYHNAQVPSAIPYPTMTPGTTALVLQLGNVLLLLAALAIVCCWTPHPEIARRYLLIVAVADIGHIYSCYAAMGSTQFWDFANYNDMGAYPSNPMVQSWISSIAFRFFCLFVVLSFSGRFRCFDCHGVLDSNQRHLLCR